MADKILEWLGNWYQTNCNGNWEHTYGMVIETIDNPGWSITIDLEGTLLESKSTSWVFIENSPNDWYGYKFQDGKFEASGDPSKLEFLIILFKGVAESNGNIRRFD